VQASLMGRDEDDCWGARKPAGRGDDKNTPRTKTSTNQRLKHTLTAKADTQHCSKHVFPGLARTPRRGGLLGGSLAPRLAAASAVRRRGSSSSPKGAAMASHTHTSAKAMTFDIISALPAQGPLARRPAWRGGEGQPLGGFTQAQLQSQPASPLPAGPGKLHAVSDSRDILGQTK